MTKTKETPSSDIEEHERAVYMSDELKRAQQFLQNNGADDEMLEAIQQFIQDKQMWMHKDLLVSGSA